MPIFFIILGLVLIDSGIRGNAPDTLKQLGTDAQGFLAFGAVILILDLLAVTKTFRPVAVPMLVLVFVGFIVKGGNGIKIVKGVQDAIATQVAVNPQATENADLAAANSNTGSGSGGSLLGQGASLLGNSGVDSAVGSAIFA